MPNLDLIIQRLRLRGHRVTDSRRQVLAGLMAAPAHFTVDDVIRQTPGVGRATVFRTMKLLQNMNIVCRVLLEDGSLHYRLGSRGHHPHLVCRSCGRVEDFSTCDVASVVEQLTRNTEYEIEGHWLEVYGRCSSCRILEQVAVQA